MSLKIEVSFDTANAMQEHVVHRDRVCTQVLGTIDDGDARERSLGIFANEIAVGIDHDLRDLRALLKLQDDLVIQRTPSELPVILPRHAATVVTHRDDGTNGWLHCDAVLSAG